MNRNLIGILFLVSVLQFGNEELLDMNNKQVELHQRNTIAKEEAKITYVMFYNDCILNNNILATDLYPIVMDSHNRLDIEESLIQQATMGDEEISRVIPFSVTNSEMDGLLWVTN